MPELKTFQLPGVGLHCSECGGILPRVSRTKTTDGFVLRERICPTCGVLNTTTERVISTRDRRTTFSQPAE